jgi:hypothetical protein
LEIRRPLDVLLQAFAHSRAARVDLDLQRFSAVADLRFVPPPAPRPIRFNDTSHTQRLMKDGYELARAYLGDGERATAARA